MSQKRWLMVVVFLLVITVWPASYFAASLQQARQDFDRESLLEILGEDAFDNDPVADAILIKADGSQNLINPQWLGLRRDRYAYIGKQYGEVVLVVLPYTIDDGFNGTLDLLVAFDMRGEIAAARVLAPPRSKQLDGQLQVRESRWMREFTGMTSRELRRPTWQGIAADDGVDQFVGASLTPKAVAAGMYDALLFFQSNRMALMQGAAALERTESN